METKPCIHPEGHAGRIVTLKPDGQDWFFIEAVAKEHVLLKNFVTGLLQMRDIEDVCLYLVEMEQVSRLFGNFATGEPLPLG